MTMQAAIRVMFLVVSITGLLLCDSLEAQSTVSPFVGRWKLVGAAKDGKPVSPPPPPPNARPLPSESVMEISVEEFKVTITKDLTIFLPDSPPRLADRFKVEYDSRPREANSSDDNSWRASLEQKKIILTKTFRNGPGESRVVLTIVDDGQTLIRTTENLDPEDCKQQTVSGSLKSTKTKTKAKKTKCDEIVGISETYARIL